MAVVKPFRGLRYNIQKINSLSDVVVPPYDIISPEELKILKGKSAYNYAHLILSGDSATYKEAAGLLKVWQDRQILLRDPRPCLYFYKQTFTLDPYELFCQTVPDSVRAGGKLVRTGIFARIGLEEYASKIILPHEKTFAVHKADRYKLMEATGGNMEPVFLGYDSKRLGGDEFEEITRNRKPDGDYTDMFGVEHKLWAVDDTNIHETVEKGLSQEAFYILDGHHRYETALQFYKDHQKSEGSLEQKYVLADICSFHQPGTIILPTHRLVKGLNPEKLAPALQRLEGDFDFVKVKDLENLQSLMAGEKMGSFGLTIGGKEGLQLLQLKESARRFYAGTLDLDLLHGHILPMFAPAKGEAEISYVKSIPEWQSRLQSAEFQVGFLVRPTKSGEVMTVARESKKMPHKSTFFYPKIPSGLVINLFD